MLGEIGTLEKERDRGGRGKCWVGFGRRRTEKNEHVAVDRGWTVRHKGLAIAEKSNLVSEEKKNSLKYHKKSVTRVAGGEKKVVWNPAQNKLACFN